jgi:hypothetical protein
VRHTFPHIVSALTHLRGIQSQKEDHFASLNEEFYSFGPQDRLWISKWTTNGDMWQNRGFLTLARLLWSNETSQLPDRLWFH